MTARCASGRSRERGAGLSLLGALVLLIAACGGGSGAVATPTAPGGSKDPSKWPADDRSMCDWRSDPELEVAETLGPGALKPNVRRVYKTIGEARRRVLVCREVDTNLDGVKDVGRTFDENGQAIHEEADTNFDGKVDVWLDFVGGRIAQAEVDTNHDGKADVWKFYVNGQLQRIRRDTNHDGEPDVWEIYTDGRLERVGVDLNHDGHVDRWDRDDRSKSVAESSEQGAPSARAGADDAGAPSPNAAPPAAKAAPSSAGPNE